MFKKLKSNARGLVDANYDPEGEAAIRSAAAMNKKNKKRTNTRPAIIPKEQKITSKELAI